MMADQNPGFAIVTTARPFQGTPGLGRAARHQCRREAPPMGRIVCHSRIRAERLVRASISLDGQTQNAFPGACLSIPEAMISPITKGGRLEPAAAGALRPDRA